MSHHNHTSAGFSRRQFLRGAITGTVATVVLPGLTGHALPAAEVPLGDSHSGKQGPTVRLQRARLPILRKADVIVVGGSLPGMAAALEWARAGRKVVLVEHRNYLGREISATLKPWVDLGQLRAGAPEPFATCLKRMEAANKLPGDLKGETPLWMDAFKVSAEDVLLEAGVELVYASLPTEVLVTGGAIGGVVIGNKSGRQALLGRMVLDASSTAIVARLAGAEFEPESADDCHYMRMMELEGVGPLGQASLEVPAELGIAGNKLTVHHGYRGQDHVLIECPMELKPGKMDLDAMMRRESEARRRTLRVASHLIQHVPAFNKASLGIFAYELDGPQTTRLAGPVPRWAAAHGASELEFSDKHRKNVRLPLTAFAGPLSGLWCVNEAARLEKGQHAVLRDPVNGALAGAAFAKALLSKQEGGEIAGAEPSDDAVPDHLPHDLGVKSQDSPQRGRFYERLNVPAAEVPLLRETDFVVVGGGTSGATCAASGGREGAKTMLLEFAPGLGGTGTVGGVCAYWYGRYWTGFCLRNAKLVDEVHKTVNIPAHTNELNGRWSIECKMYALLKDAQDAGVEVF